MAGPIAGVSLQVRPGDVLGIAGITGSGRETLLSAIFGAQPREGGTITVNGQELQPQRPDLAMTQGLAYLPPDRKIQGAIMEFTARENLVITDLKPFWRGLRLRGRQEVSETRTWFQRLGVRPVDGVSQRFSSFSGGNQQKILFGKWLRRTPLVLLLDEPTQGVDVGAKAELHRQLLAAAEEGAGLVISTSDLDELVALSHRVLVLRDGRIVAHRFLRKRRSDRLAVRAVREDIDMAEVQARIHAQPFHTVTLAPVTRGRHDARSCSSKGRAGAPSICTGLRGCLHAMSESLSVAPGGRLRSAR